MFVKVIVFGWRLIDTKPELIEEMYLDMKNVKRAIS